MAILGGGDEMTPDQRNIEEKQGKNFRENSKKLKGGVNFLWET